MNKEPEESVVRLVVVIKKDLHRKLKTYAAQNDLALRDVVISQLQKFVDSQESK